jgi:hypothetical protein
MQLSIARKEGRKDVGSSGVPDSQDTKARRCLCVQYIAAQSILHVSENKKGLRSV